MTDYGFYHNFCEIATAIIALYGVISSNCASFLSFLGGGGVCSSDAGVSLKNTEKSGLNRVDKSSSLMFLSHDLLYFFLIFQPINIIV